MAYLTCTQQILAKEALRDRLAQAERIELHHARQIVGETVRLAGRDVDGMLVSRLLRALGWNKLDPAANGRNIAYGRRPV